jgi:hypothetical protein
LVVSSGELLPDGVRASESPDIGVEEELVALAET